MDTCTNHPTRRLKSLRLAPMSQLPVYEPDPTAYKYLPGKARTPTGNPAKRGVFLIQARTLAAAAAPLGACSGGWGSVVEVEVLGRFLLEPEPIVLGGVLQELRCLLEDVLALFLGFLDLALLTLVVALRLLGGRLVGARVGLRVRFRLGLRLLDLRGLWRGLTLGFDPFQGLVELVGERL